MTATARLKNLIKPLVPQPVRERVQAYRNARFMSDRGIHTQFNQDTIDVCRGTSTIRISRKQKVYLMEMATYFDYFFDAVQTESGVADFSQPRAHRLTGFNDFPIVFPSIPEPYVTIQQYLEFAALKPGSIVLDLGAYAAVTSIAFAREAGFSGRTFAFEADPGNFLYAQQTVATAQAAGYPPVELIQQAVWSHNRGIQFSVEGAMGSRAIAFQNISRSLSRKLSSHPARLNFPLMDPLEPSLCMALRAMCLSTAMLFGPLPIRVRS